MVVSKNEQRLPQSEKALQNRWMRSLVESVARLATQKQFLNFMKILDAATPLISILFYLVSEFV